MQPDDRNSISSKPTALPGRAVAPADAPPAAADTSRTLSSQDTAGGAGSTSSAGALSLDIERKVFAERFDLLEELGSGGMGRVLKAFDRKLQRAVAVKRIKGPLATDPDLLRRFLREAQFAARLNHPNVVTVHDILTDDEGPYLVLEFIDGESLAQRLHRGGAIPWREAIELLLPICDAVTAAHAQGIIHRDIKPANILLPRKGPPKLADFGIARSLEGSDLTASGAVLGTLDYMAPEQMDVTKSVDERTDVYGLAATLYHLVTGEPPRPISLDAISIELRSIVIQGLQRYPEKRQNDVLSFRNEVYQVMKPIVRRNATLLTTESENTVLEESIDRNGQQFREGLLQAILVIRDIKTDSNLFNYGCKTLGGVLSVSVFLLKFEIYWPIPLCVAIFIVLVIAETVRGNRLTSRLRSQLSDMNLGSVDEQWESHKNALGDDKTLSQVLRLLLPFIRPGEMSPETMVWCREFVAKH